MGVYAGFLLNYRSEKLGDKTFFLTIGTVQTLIKNGYKSISRETAADLGYEVEATKKITRYTYDIKALMRAVVAGEYIPYK
jgi:penicillin-binding protein-related factor A (putative recombinase)